ncbi:hypothetical protein IFM89_027429 [Coptis chinensis]|uniref:RRM domain-containing protein n=1 Tax=Coptis chinensis TaxID=261450 RepID=A0A835H7K6_9MAGN|nr:hypothetical protein IFM89_027429 [Coptis chinensis]
MANEIEKQVVVSADAAGCCCCRCWPVFGVALVPILAMNPAGASSIGVVAAAMNLLVPAITGVRDVDLKHDFTFIEFSDPHDANDARYSLNGRQFDGSRMVVEFAKGLVLRIGISFSSWVYDRVILVFARAIRHRYARLWHSVAHPLPVRHRYAHFRRPDAHPPPLYNTDTRAPDAHPHTPMRPRICALWRPDASSPFPEPNNL